MKRSNGAGGRQPLVSVIMPAYNAEKYIGEAIASVRAQTYENWELLILDDGSADRTAEIAQAYAQRDARIRVLRNPQNMGVARTRNRGFDLAQGEWIALLDSDDRWRAQKLEKQLALAVRSGSRLLYTSYALFVDTEREMRVYCVPQSVDYRRLLGENVIGCSTVLLHRSEQSRSFDKRAAAVNRWRIYRDVERLSLPRSACAFFSYALHGVHKHGRI